MAQMAYGRSRRCVPSSGFVLVYASLVNVAGRRHHHRASGWRTCPRFSFHRKRIRRGQRQASVASKGTGCLEYLGVKVGSHLAAGDILFRLISSGQFDQSFGENGVVNMALFASVAEVYDVAMQNKTL